MTDNKSNHNTIEESFAYYTECALATAEGLDMVKSSSQSARRRAWNIANNMVADCIRYKVSIPGPFSGRGLPCLRARMEAARD